MSEGNDFNPNSTDAVFSRILQRLSDQDVERKKMSDDVMVVLQEIRAEVRKTNGRVTRLEHWQTMINARVATIAFLVSALIPIFQVFGKWVIAKFSQ